MSYTLRLAFLFVLSLSLTQLHCTRREQDSIARVKKGHLSLEQMSSPPSIFQLEGEWEIYWNELYIPADFDVAGRQEELNRKRSYIGVPQIWNELADRNRKAGRGLRYATLRMQWTGSMPDSLTWFLNRASSASRVYCRDFVGKQGQVVDSSYTSSPGYAPVLFQLPPSCYEGQNCSLGLNDRLLFVTDGLVEVSDPKGNLLDEQGLLLFAQDDFNLSLRAGGGVDGAIHKAAGVQGVLQPKIIVAANLV